MLILLQGFNHLSFSNIKGYRCGVSSTVIHMCVFQIPSQSYQLGEMTYSGNLCAKSRPVNIVLQIAHFLSIKDSLSCKEAADSED